MRPLAFLTLVFFTNCATLRTTVDYDKSADFTQIQTYSCVAIESDHENDNPAYYSDASQRLIEYSIRNELSKRGFREEKDAPDIVVSYDIIIEDKLDSRSLPTKGYRYWRAFEVDVFNYTSGTLVINMVDKAQDQLIWRGTAKGMLDVSTSRLDSKIKKAVTSIFSQYTFSKPVN